MIDINDKNKVIRSLNLTGYEQSELWKESVNVRNSAIGNKVHLRGLIEFSNFCQKDCFYCGIRSENCSVKRYRMNIDSIMSCVDFAWNSGIYSVVLQSGELDSNDFKSYLTVIVKAIKSKYKNIAITLSCGEFDYDFFRELYILGVERYLLRIESSNKNFYSKIHPSTHSFEKRKQCLFDMQNIGYQVGTGNMIGIPGQTDDMIYEDLKFFVNNDFDMFGLGPYIIHTETPLGTKENILWWKENKNKILDKALNFIAILRILRPTVNIATATALDVINTEGRIMALKAGANVVMPSITPSENKRNYFLYQNKPNVDDECERILLQVCKKIELADMVPVFNERGSSLFYKQKNKNNGIF